MKILVDFRRLTTVTAVLVNLVLSLTTIHAAVPREISYQGVLLDQNGVPLPGPVDLVLCFYDVAMEGVSLFEEEHTDVILTNGVYAIQIGSGVDPGTATPTNGIPDNILSASQLWLGVLVDGGVELSPRTSISSVIFALKSEFSESLLSPTAAEPAVFVDSSSNVGVGTTIPTEKLDVSGTVKATSFVGNGSGLTGVGDGHSLDSADGNRVDALVVDNAGNVGIGLVDPEASLHIESPGNSLIDLSTTSTEFNSRTRLISVTTNERVETQLQFRNQFHFVAPLGGEGGTERMTILENGNVGIGTDNPTAGLQVVKDTNDPGAGLIVDRVNGQIQLVGAPTSFGVWTIQADAMRIGKWTGDGAGTLILDNAGNVGIGKNPSARFDVEGQVCATNISCSSDIRWKKNVEVIGNGLENVMNLRGVEYNWRTDEFEGKNFEEGEQIGFIAQEVEKVIPEVVRTDNNGYKSLDYARLTAVLVEAVKELKVEKDKEIEELKAENRALATRLEALEQQLSMVP